MNEGTTTETESATWPERVTRRMQQRPDDQSGFRAKLVGLSKEVPWEARRVKGNRGEALSGPTVTTEETEQGLDEASRGDV